MDNQNLIPDPDMDVFEREERCRRAIKSVGKAIVMRLVVIVLIIWAFSRAPLNGWLIGLMLFVIVIDLSAMPPLVKELKNRHAELNALLDSEE